MKKLLLGSILLLSINTFPVQKTSPKKIRNQNEAKKICLTVCGKDNWDVGKYTSDSCECKN